MLAISEPISEPITFTGGTNVNNWHWREYDALPWAKLQLQEAFLGSSLLDGEINLAVNSVEVTGEAAINNRKNKLIPAVRA